MSSIRREIACTLTVGLGALLIALNGAVAWFGSRAQAEAFDAQLEERARTFTTLVVQRGPYVELEFAEGLMPAYSRAEAPDYFQAWIVGAGGGVLERSDSLGDRDLPRPEEGLAAPRLAPLVLPDGRRGRVAQFAAEIHEYEESAADGRRASQRTVAVAVATGLAPLTAAHRALLTWLLAADALFMLGSVLVVSATLKRGLAPIDAFSRRLAHVRRPDQSPALSALAAPVELRPIAASVEDMLARLGAAFARERRLSGNIAHELRTPIAELRLAAEVALARPNDYVGLRSAVQDAREIAIEMERTITALLRLWRGEQDEDQALLRGDLSAALEGAVHGATVLATARGIDFPVAPTTCCEVAVAERPLALVVSNLVQNAAAHARRGSTVHTSIERVEGAALLVIDNELDAHHDHTRVAESDVGALQHPDHAGLGLPLARALCDSTGMELDVRAADGRYVARLRVPLRRAA